MAHRGYELIYCGKCEKMKMHTHSHFKENPRAKTNYSDYVPLGGYGNLLKDREILRSKQNRDD